MVRPAHAAHDKIAPGTHPLGFGGGGGIAPWINLAADCVVLILAAVAATTSAESGTRVDLAALLALIGIFVWLLGSRVLWRYDVRKGQGLSGDLALTSVLVLLVAAAVAVLWDLVPHHAAAIRMSHFLLVLWPGTLALRIVIPGLRLITESPPDEVLILGAGSLGRHTGLAVRERAPERPIVGYLSFAGEPADEHLPARILGDSADLERVIRERPLGEVYIAGSMVQHAKAIEAAVHTCERYGVPFALPAIPFRLERARPERRDSVPEGYVHYVSYKPKPVQVALKRVFDILASAAVLLVLSPLFVAVAILVKLTSRGPVFFRQRRVGLHGRAFDMLKFRSMVDGAEQMRDSLLDKNELSGPVFKIKEDPRITAVGRILRKFSIDELPQFINVLRGEMSIVGPRPPLPGEVAQYEPWARRRLSVRPGITCVWQVSGRNDVSFERWMYLDMQYIDHWSLKGDLLLILKTIPTVLRGRGAS